VSASQSAFRANRYSTPSLPQSNNAPVCSSFTVESVASEMVLAIREEKSAGLFRGETENSIAAAKRGFESFLACLAAMDLEEVAYGAP
jgi:hypothetical protein